MDKPKLFDTSNTDPLFLEDCLYLPEEMIEFAKKQGIRNLRSLYSVLESSPSVQKLLPEGMYATVMKEIQERYEIPVRELPQKREYNALPPKNLEWMLDKTTQEIEEKNNEEKELGGES